MRMNTHYYEADIGLLESLLLRDQEEKSAFMREMIPLLREKNANTHMKPKIIFLDGREQCRNAYLELLAVKGIFFEF